MKIKLLTPNYGVEEVSFSITELLRKNPLCAMATVSNSEGSPLSHINTAFYCYTEDMVFYVLTPPSTQHGQNLAFNDSIALAVYDSHQIWDAPKQGLQLFGTARLTNKEETIEALRVYLENYPGLKKYVELPEEIDEKLESRFYRVEISRIKVFDEPTFGGEVWIDAYIER